MHLEALGPWMSTLLDGQAALALESIDIKDTLESFGSYFSNRRVGSFFRWFTVFFVFACVSCYVLEKNMKNVKKRKQKKKQENEKKRSKASTNQSFPVCTVNLATRKVALLSLLLTNHSSPQNPNQNTQNQNQNINININTNMNCSQT